MRQKIDICADHFAAGDFRAALKIAAGWPDSAPAIKAGYEALMRPDFQRQLARDPGAIAAAGIAALGDRLARRRG